MTVQRDPEGNETAALHGLVNFSGKRAFEIGCGDGRLTWRYADSAAHVVAIDPNPDFIADAIKARPGNLSKRVEFVACGIEDLPERYNSSKFDVAIFAWSL